jgi:hypothetical protein
MRVTAIRAVVLWLVVAVLAWWMAVADSDYSPAFLAGGFAVVAIHSIVQYNARWLSEAFDFWGALLFAGVLVVLIALRRLELEATLSALVGSIAFFALRYSVRASRGLYARQAEIDDMSNKRVNLTRRRFSRYAR